MFAVPCVSFTVCVEFLHSYLATTQLLLQAGIQHGLVNINGDCYLGSARNRLVHKALTEFPDATDLFFLDDDIGWEPEAVLRLLADDVDVVAGVYPKKQETLEFPVVMDESSGHLIKSVSGLFKALRVPTGFLRIRRHVLEQMAAVSAKYIQQMPDGGNAELAEIFQVGVKDGRLWGEDFDWSNKWRAMGGELWVDPTITFTHSGRKQWKARLWDSAQPVQSGAVPAGQCAHFNQPCRSVSSCMLTGKCILQAKAEEMLSINEGVVG